ncbi:MAG: hypothetical protein MI862_26770 [Desulfobacterales bacterium]|nr:hypothetical protein [Desulfobacterales bacterium]
MIEKKILSWIKKTGFPLEMETAAAFKKANFEVLQSFIYPDSQQNKGREIDVVAHDPDWLGLIEISFVLECKSSKKPWVVLTSEDTLPYNRLLAFAISTKDAKNVMAKHLMNKEPLRDIIHSLKANGYGFHQALGNKKDEAYTAVINLAKACTDITIERNVEGFPRIAFAFPVIVIDSPLFECLRTDRGEIEIKEVDESSFIFSAYLPERTGCCVQVVKKESLLPFAKRSKQLAAAIRKCLKAEEEAFLSKIDT